MADPKFTSRSKSDILITAGLDLGSVGSDVNVLTDTLSKLDRTIYGKTFSSTNELTQAFQNFGGSLLNAAESVPVLGAGLKQITSGFAASANDANDLNVALTTQAESYEQLTSKFSELEKLRAHARANDNNNPITASLNRAGDVLASAATGKPVAQQKQGRLEYEEGQIKSELANIVAKYTHNIEEETAALDASDIATIRRVRLAKLDIDAQAKIAAVSQKLKNPLGELSPQAQQIVAAETKRILAEEQITKNALNLTLKKEESERDINNILATRGITIDEELRVNQAVQNALEGQIQLLKDQGKEKSLLYSQLQAQLHETALQYNQIVHNREKETKAAKDATEVMAAQLTGNRLLASEAEIRAKYEVQIAEALRHGNQELVNQLQTQQRLETLRARAAYDLMSPGQRHQQRTEARRLGRALQREASRDRVNAEADNPELRKQREARSGGLETHQLFSGKDHNMNRVSQRDYVPASVTRAIGSTGASSPKVGTLQVSTLNVQTIKTAP